MRSEAGRVRIEKIANRIQCRSQYALPGMKNIIPGAYFSDRNPIDPYWSLPLSVANCLIMRETFGARLSVGPILAEWYREETSAQAAMAELATSSSVTLKRLPEVAPALAAAMDNRPYQKAGVAFGVTGKSVLIADEPGLGKGHPHGTRLLTPTGWTQIEGIQVGDEVIGSNGKPTSVTGVFPRGSLQIYRVTFSDGSSVLVDGDHLWTAQTKNHSRTEDNWRVVETRSLIGREHQSWRIPLVQPIHFQGQVDLPIDPYLLGVLLGDGALTMGAVFCPGDELVPAEVARVVPTGYKLKRNGNGAINDPWSITNSPRSAPNEIYNAIRDMGLAVKSQFKFIPEQYLFASPEDRLSLLQGLLDTDGDLSTQHTIGFSSSSLELARHTEFLIQSLGGTCKRSSKWGKRPTYTYRGQKKLGLPSYPLRAIKLPADMCPVRAQKVRFTPLTKYLPVRIIRSIKPEGVAPVTCISVEATDSLYVTENCIVTHNTLQAIGAVVESGVPGPYLVIAPKTAVESVWAPEIRRWVPGANILTVPDGKVARENLLNGFAAAVDITKRNAEQGTSPDSLGTVDLSNMWVVVHPHMIRTESFWECREPECGALTKFTSGVKELDCGHDAYFSTTINKHVFPQLFWAKYGAVIADEGHDFLVKKTKTPTLARRGAELIGWECVRDDALRIALSGTPFRGRPYYMWGVLNWLDNKMYSGKWRFIETYWEVTKSWGYEIGGIRPEREKWMYKELDKIVLRRTKLEVAPDLPEKDYWGTLMIPGDESSPKAVWLEMTTKQAKAHTDILRSAHTELEGGELDAVGVLAQRTRMKQFATASGAIEASGQFKPSMPSNKVDWILEQLEEMGFPDSPTTRVIIASQFTEVLRLLTEALASKGIASCAVTGSVTGRQQTKVISDFNTPGTGPDVMLLQTQTGGVAITIDTADLMIVVDETDNYADQVQLEDRIHRVSKPRPVAYAYLKSRGSIEEGIAQINYTRKQQGLQILDGRRGIGDMRAEMDAIPGRK